MKPPAQRLARHPHSDRRVVAASACRHAAAPRLPPGSPIDHAASTCRRQWQVEAGSCIAIALARASTLDRRAPPCTPPPLPHHFISSTASASHKLVANPKSNHPSRFVVAGLD
jgi:hypothetical protein